MDIMNDKKTKDVNELLLVDFCARIPYGVIISDGLHDVKLNVRTDTVAATIIEFFRSKNLIYYLRPMESMTVEERAEMNELEVFTDYASTEEYVRYVNWLNMKMFDYRGLLETGIPNVRKATKDMYTTK